MSLQDGDVIYGAPDDKTLLRSTNRGQSWSPYFSAKHAIRLHGRSLFWVSPHDAARTFIRGGNGDLVMLEGTAGALKQTSLLLRAELSPLPVDFAVKKVAFSMQDPRLIYVLLDISGAEVVWRGQLDAAYTGASWTPITNNAPRIAMSSQLFVHPITGDVFITSGHGTWVHPPPEGPGTHSAWLGLPQPFANGWYPGL